MVEGFIGIDGGSTSTKAVLVDKDRNILCKTYQLSRGCTDKCSFCSEWVFWRHFRLSKMDKAVVEVAELQRRWGIERIWFTDSLLNGQMNRLRDFATGINYGASDPRKDGAAVPER